MDRPAPRKADGALEALRVPPHSIEAEQSVLGGLMLDNDSFVSIEDRVSSDDFYRHEHRLVFLAIQALSNAAKPYDVITVSEWLRDTGQTDKAGGLPYLAELLNNTPTAANIAAYADIVRSRSVLRQLIRAGIDIADRSFLPEGRTSDELLDLAEMQVFKIANKHGRGRLGYRDIKDLVPGVLERIDVLYHNKSPITGVATGFVDFDELTAGLQTSDLVIVAGRPSMGKTAFAINIAEHAALQDGHTVVIFSMEMPGEQLAMRTMASLSRVDVHRVRTGKLSDDDWPRLVSTAGLLTEKAKMFIDDTPALTPGELRARCRRVAREHGLGLVIVDYLQLMQVPGTKENRATEISEISRSLKSLAKELRVPVVAVSQLNRELEKRPNKRPVMSDLRESGAIEQDADLIVFIYRDEVYDSESPDKGVAEIIVAKQRNGPIGTVRMTF
ncbi:MAG: replicative DNA helicase, partial [Gammaproteobacteria bacterium]